MVTRWFLVDGRIATGPSVLIQIGYWLVELVPLCYKEMVFGWWMNCNWFQCFIKRWFPVGGWIATGPSVLLQDGFWLMKG